MMYSAHNPLKKVVAALLLVSFFDLTECATISHSRRHLRHGTINLQKRSQFTRRPIKCSKRFWGELQQSFQLRHEKHKAPVKTQIRHFLKKPYQLNQTLKRSAPYLYYIHTQVKKRHLPGELALLPFIESTYNPYATNKTSKAAGLWQLTSPTAQKFGVRQNAIFDGKYDLFASTEAALDYLSYLNQLFDKDWLLSLTAYTAGEGSVNKAIASNRYRHKKNFWHLRLGVNTMAYAPKLLALSAIIKNPKKYGIELPAIYQKPYLERVQVAAGISMIQAATLAHMKLAVVKRFNAGFKQPYFAPKKPYYLLLPAHHAKIFKRNLAGSSLPPLPFGIIYHRVKPKDTLIKIAKYYRVTVKQICQWNDLKANQPIFIHQLLIIKK